AYAVLEQKTAAFCDELNREFRQESLAFEVTRAGSIFWVHVRADFPIRRIEQIPANNSESFARLFHGALNRGLYLAPSGYEVNFMSLAHTDELLERAAKGIVAAAREASNK